MSDDHTGYADECGDHGGANRSGDPCGRPAGWGTDFDSGKCKHHRGTNADGSSHEDNLYAEKHALFVETNKYYSEVMTEAERELCDAIERGYLEDYHEIHGKPNDGHGYQIFQISVNHIKVIHADNWSIDKHPDLNSGNPLVDKETSPVPMGEGDYTTEVTYSEAVTVGTQKKLRSEDRQWLKSYGLLEADPDTQQADAMRSIASILGDTE